MQNCSSCNSIAMWKCSCSDTFFCNYHIIEHSSTHASDSVLPDVSQILFTISDRDSIHLKQEIHHRLNTINSFKENILTQTNILISEIKKLSKDAISQLDNEKLLYKNLMMKSYYEKEDYEKVKQILRTNLKIKKIKADLELSKDIKYFYKIPHFKNNINFKGSYAVSKIAGLYDIHVQSHNSFVLSIAISHDNKIIASGSHDKFIRIWNLQEKRQEFYLEGHKSSVLALSFTPDGKKLISGSKDSMIIVWNLKKRCKQCEFKGNLGEIWGLAVTINNDIVLSASNDGSVIAWNIDNLSEISKLNGHEDSAICIVISNNGEFCISGSSDKSLIIWDLETFKQKGKLLGHRDGVCAVSLSKDNKKALSGSADMTIRIWDIESMSQSIIIQAHENIVRSVAISSDGSFAVSASYDKLIRVWDLKNVSLLKEMKGHIGEINSIVITEDNELAISGADDLTVRVWDIKTGKENFNMPGHSKLVIGGGVFENDNKVFTISNDETICIWDCAKKCQTKQIKWKSYRIDSISIANIKKVIFSIANENIILPALDFNAHLFFSSIYFSFSGKKCMAISHSEEFMIIGSVDKNLYICESNNSKKIIFLSYEFKAKLAGHTDAVNTVAITKNDEKAVSGGSDNLIIIWDIKSLTKESLLCGHTGPISSISIFNSKLISTSYDKSIRLWNLNTQKCAAIFHGHTSWVLCSSISADGKTFATGGGDEDCGIIIWDLNEKIMKNELVGHRGAITGVSIIKNGSKIVSASIDKTSRLWDAQTGIQEKILCTFNEGLSALCMTDDEKYAVIGTEDMRIFIWDIDHKRILIEKSNLSFKGEIKNIMEKYSS